MDDSIPRLEVEHPVNPRWLGVFLLIAAASVFTRQVTLFFAGAILLLALGISWLWGRYCLDGLEYQRAFSSPAVDFGGEVTLTVTIVNRKILPLSWLEVEDEAPKAVELTRGKLLPSWKVGRTILQQMLSLRWYERVIRRYRFRCPTRGEQVFGPAELRSGDIFGLAKRRIDLPGRHTILVYPKVVPVAALSLPARFLLGDQRRPNHLFQDPLQVAGIRPYAQGDSPRQVHWKASARLGTLQVKINEPTAALKTVLYLNLSTTAAAWMGYRPDLLELSICVTASLAHHLAEGGAQFGLIANGFMPHANAASRLPASGSPRQLTAVLTLLAQISPLMTVPFTSLLAAERRRAPEGAAVVLITGLLDDQILRQAHAYRASGHPVTLLLIGDDLRDSQPPGLPTYWIGDEAHWRDLPALRVDAHHPEGTAPCST